MLDPSKQSMPWVGKPAASMVMDDSGVMAMAGADALCEHMEYAILTGRVDERLPTIKEMCRLFRLSHCTVKKALERLERRQLIAPHQGRGIAVNRIACGNPLFGKNIVFYMDVQRLGVPYYLNVFYQMRLLLQDSGCLIHLATSAAQLERLPFVPDSMILVAVHDAAIWKISERCCGRERLLRLDDSAGDIPVVGTDNFEGGRLAAEHLHRRGHRDVGVLAYDYGSSDAFFAPRRRGFQAFADEHGDFAVAHRAVTVADAAPGAATAARAAVADLFAARPGITAVFAFTDKLALAVYAFCATQGWSIPGRVSVVGFDDRDFAPLLHPGLTTFREDAAAVARGLRDAVVFSVSARTAGTAAEVATPDVKVAPVLVERDSVADVPLGST